MAKLLSGRSPYNPWKLVNHRKRGTRRNPLANIHIICDIDKTYLETNFATVASMARIAFEHAEDKVTVDGANDVLLAARWGNIHELDTHQRYPRPLHFVSSSPPQLRSVLEYKLTLDGLDWDSDTFKDQAYNIRKGRFGLLKQQVGYKTAAILSLVQKMEDGSEIILLGDNAESDPIIYLGVKFFLEQKIQAEEYKEWLALCGISATEAEIILERFTELPKVHVHSIFIRKMADKHAIIQQGLTEDLSFFSDYFEVALEMICDGVVDMELLESLTRSFHNTHNMGLDRLQSSLTSFLPHADQPLQAEIRRVIELLQHPNALPNMPLPVPKREPCPASELMQRAEAWILEMQDHRD